MVRSFALRFGLLIGLACAFWGANPAHAAFEDLATLYSQVPLLLNGFTERAKAAGGSTAEAYLKLDDVKGSSTNSAYKDQIPVFYFQNFVVTTGGAVGTGSGKASPSDYYLVIPADQSGPILEQAAASGKPFVKAIISTLRAVGGLLVVSRLDTLEDVRVSFYMKTTTAVTSQPEIAIIGLQFAKASWAYGAVKACRDYAANRNC